MDLALSNLIDNAICYSTHTKHLTIRASQGERPSVVVVEVIDRGPGIADDVKQSIFELFTRGRATTDIPGLGLGLPMARTLVAAIGGEMSIDDRPGGGTIVRIVFH